MRLCPLAGVVIPCSVEQPLCPWCDHNHVHDHNHDIGLRDADRGSALVSIVPAHPAYTKRTCPDCGAMYTPRGSNHRRCQGCAVVHARKKNLEYQHAFRQRQRLKHPPHPRLIPDTERMHFEMLHAEGMSANAIAFELGRNRRTVAKHLARPDAQRRVSILRLDGPEPELPH